MISKSKKDGLTLVFRSRTQNPLSFVSEKSPGIRPESYEDDSNSSNENDNHDSCSDSIINFDDDKE